MRISFLHTAQVHVDTFDAIFREIWPDAELTHNVIPELLSRAQVDGLDAVRSETTTLLQDMLSDDAVMCTCTTLGPIADALTDDHLLRIDRPVMEYACAQGARILVAICLEATRTSTTDLLAECAGQMGVTVKSEILLIDTAWPHFESGNLDQFADGIASAIRDAVAVQDYDCVVLAQASMHVAEPLLQGIGVPVVSSPKMAAMRAVEIAESSM
jgi:hypothetical protein